MTTPVRLQVRGPGGARCVLDHLTSETTIDDLRSQISTLMDIHPDVQRLMIGFPPRPIDTVSPQTTLATAGVRSGESIIVEKSTAPRGIQKASAAESQSVIYTIPKNTGMFVQRAMPPDNSCLFHSVAYVCKDRARDAAVAMRKMIADAVAASPAVYNETLLEQSNASYQSFIMNPNVWGGAIELLIFSRLFETEIVAFDPDYLREDVFGQDAGYTRRVFLLFSAGRSQESQAGGHAAHYDALVFSPGGSPNDDRNDKVVFSAADMYAWERARQFIEHMHRERCTKNPQLQLCKQWRRSKTGAPTRPSTGYSLTASSSSSPSAPSATWACSACTFVNQPGSRQCEVCQTARK
ncbi:hypothetical protein PBRA_009024 [Plasmodiophora brassicae]|uniref:Ubiquitin thioesterase OTU n=1 Tax=Plasmodiophora brassicae TaxID=37360 RepID=A0A0G4J4C8_PLABS|nr:hypothetical protein PBRA_009024 [Plasmodiophora brassicae]